jgi:hypothetical protein
MRSPRASHGSAAAAASASRTQTWKPNLKTVFMR